MRRVKIPVGNKKQNVCHAEDWNIGGIPVVRVAKQETQEAGRGAVGKSKREPQGGWSGCKTKMVASYGKTTLSVLLDISL